jgi:hypothetical protein
MPTSNNQTPKIDRLSRTGDGNICKDYIIEQKRIKALMIEKSITFAQARKVVEKDLDDRVVKATNIYKEDL